jgi:hypothetical protein
MNTTYYKERATAARWLKERATKADLWTWVVLTKHNPDPQNPGLDDVTARRVFEDLERQGLLEPIPQKLAGSELVVGAYRLNLTDQEKWGLAAKPPGKCRVAVDWVWKRLNEPMFVAIVSGVFSLIGAFIGAVIAVWVSTK